MKVRLVIGVVLALSGPVLAVQGAAEEWKETLDLVGEQTKATLGIVADPTQGLAAANNRIDLMASALADTNKAVSEVAASVERLRGPANLVWVSPRWAEISGNLPGGVGPLYGQIWILNTGSAPAFVGCSFFGNDGTWLLDRAKSLTIGAGGRASCTTFPFPFPDDYDANSDGGWMIVHSDRPVLVFGTYQSHDINLGGLQRVVMDFFPVDCSSPSGIEFVCDFVNP